MWMWMWMRGVVLRPGRVDGIQRLPSQGSFRYNDHRLLLRSRYRLRLDVGWSEQHSSLPSGVGNSVRALGVLKVHEHPPHSLLRL